MGRKFRARVDGKDLLGKSHVFAVFHARLSILDLGIRNARVNQGLGG
jgi:hypothetical protein